MPESLTSTQLNCSAIKLREFLGATANIPVISDPDLELEVLSAPEFVVEGEIIEIRITAYGFKQRMQHRYVEVSDLEIVAAQDEGPTRSWVHRQSISADQESGCTLTDHIEFEPPGGMLGFVMTEEKILESIRDGMDFRYETLHELLDNAS